MVEKMLAVCRCRCDVYTAEDIAALPPGCSQRHITHYIHTYIHTHINLVENFEWPYLGNVSPDPLHVCTATMLCPKTLYITVDTHDRRLETCFTRHGS